MHYGVDYGVLSPRMAMELVDTWPHHSVTLFLVPVVTRVHC